MPLHALRKTAGRLARAVLPKNTYDYARLYVSGQLLGALKPDHPHVETFGNARADLSAALRRINVVTPTPLCLIMKRRQSDKGLASHNYTTVYYALFRKRVAQPLRVFELGLGTNNPKLPSTMGVQGRPGASLRGWTDFFPRAEVLGADIDRDILFSEPRIATFYCDQLDHGAIAAMWAQPQLAKPFDLIVEDGLHTLEANTMFLSESLHKLAPGGMYVVEDIQQSELGNWRRLLPQYATRWPGLAFHLVTLPWRDNAVDNNLVIVHREA